MPEFPLPEALLFHRKAPGNCLRNFLPCCQPIALEILFRYAGAEYDSVPHALSSHTYAERWNQTWVLVLDLWRESKSTSNYSRRYVHNAICESLQVACKAKLQMLRGEASIATKKNVPLHVAELDNPPPQKKKSWAETYEIQQYT